MARCSNLRHGLAKSVFIVAAAIVVTISPASAHDVPDNMVMRSFVKPEGAQLHFIVRTPLALLQSMGLPKRGPGYLDLARIEDDELGRAARAVAQGVALYENGARLTPDQAETRISQPSEEAFGSFEEARAHVDGPPLPDAANVFWNQGYFDAHLTYPIASEHSDFALDVQAAAGLAGRLEVVVQFVPPSGAVRAYQVHGGHGWLELDPSWYRASWTFVQLGFDHILDGIDHLLFLLCLVLPFRLRDGWSLLAVITSFTVAHSITLIAAATGAVPVGEWFPPLIEVLIALSIVYMAFENIVRAWLNGTDATDLRWRWLVTGAFGLIHGFGFSFALQNDLQFAGSHLLLSLLAFNVGVELGQLAFLLVVLPVLTLLLHHPQARRAGVVIVSALVAHTAWHWLLERMEPLRYVQWPSLEMSWPALLSIGLLLLVLFGALVWLGPAQFQQLGRRVEAEKRPRR